MTFAQWIETVYRPQCRPADEPITRSLEHLAVELKVSYRTLFYAWKGARVGLDLAVRLEELSGGVVKKESLVFLPTAAEIIARDKAAKNQATDAA